MLEPEGRDGPCIKPAGALDLMCHSRKGHLQSLMARDDVRIRKVPTALAYALADKLEELVEIDNIYFAKRADPGAPRWHVYDREKNGEIDPNFKDVVLKFSPAGGLKFLAEYAIGLKPKYHYEDVEPPKSWYPKELGFAPFALALDGRGHARERFSKRYPRPLFQDVCGLRRLWLLGEPVSEDTLVFIDELVCKPTGDAVVGQYPLIRVANHRSRVRETYQWNLITRIETCWNAITSGHVFLDMSREESDAHCQELNQVACGLATDGSREEDFYNQCTRPQYKR